MLEQALRVRDMALANRLVLPPMATEKSDGGKVTETLIHYYCERAGAIGLIITEHAYVRQDGRASAQMASFAEDVDLDGWRRLTEAVHAKGVTKIVAQINHAGCNTSEAVLGKPPLDINALSLDELAALREAFVEAALRVQACGFDGVEIHCAHGYLLNQFYRPATNHRTDGYGGTLENRLAFPCEVLGAVRQAVGDHYPIFFRFGAVDHRTCGGATVEDAIAAAPRFVEAGADVLDISGAGPKGWMIPNTELPGYFAEEAGRIRQAVNVPVLLAGGIRTRAQAEALLALERCDLIGVGRPMLTEADYGSALLAE